MAVKLINDAGDLDFMPSVQGDCGMKNKKNGLSRYYFVIEIDKDNKLENKADDEDQINDNLMVGISHKYKDKDV